MAASPPLIVLLFFVQSPTLLLLYCLQIYLKPAVMKLFSFSILAAILLLVACNNKLKVNYSEFNINGPFYLKMNETSKLKGGDLLLKFTSIPEDSRCPEDANCIWEGQVRIFIEAATTSNKKTLEYKIEKSKIGRISKDFQNYTILVEDVQPLTQSGSRIPPEDYILRMRVSPKR